MKIDEVARDIIQNVPTQKIPPRFISTIKIDELDGTTTILTGRQKDLFFKACAENGVDREFKQLRVMVEAEAMTVELLNVVDQVWAEVDRLQNDRHK